MLTTHVDCHSVCQVSMLICFHKLHTLAGVKENEIEMHSVPWVLFQYVCVWHQMIFYILKKKVKG